MWVVVTVLCVIGVVMGDVPFGIDGCDMSEEGFFDCVHQLFDLDGDNIVSLGDLQAGFTSHRVKYDAGVNATMIMKFGDLDEDGFLTMLDWNNSTRTFFKIHVHRQLTCFYCRQNGVALHARKVDTKNVQSPEEHIQSQLNKKNM